MTFSPAPHFKTKGPRVIPSGRILSCDYSGSGDISMKTYNDFIQAKEVTASPVGIIWDKPKDSKLFPFQPDLLARVA